MRYLLLILLFACCTAPGLLAQTDTAEAGQEDGEIIPWTKPTDEDKVRLGIVMGTQLITLKGGGIPNNQMMFGLLGGGFCRYKILDWLWAQQQFQFSFRGSRFGNPAGEISSIRMLCLDFPLCLLVRPFKKSNQKFGVGIQYSTLLSTDMYIDNLSFPLGLPPSIDRNDFSTTLVYQYQVEYVAIQLALKSGLRNQNLGRPWPDNAKPLNTNGGLYHFGVELNLLF